MYNLNNIKNLCEEKCQLWQLTIWDNWCKHVEQIENEYLKKVAVVDEAIDQFIINTGEESSSDNDFTEKDDCLSWIDELSDNYWMFLRK